MQAVTLALLMCLVLTAPAGAQGRGEQPPVSTARADAPIDLTGYWVSVVTQDWRWRMVTPGERRLREHSDHARSQEGGRQLGSGEGRGSGRAMQVLWSSGAHGGSNPAADQLGGRQDTQGRNRRRRADASVSFRRSPQRGPATWQGESFAEWERPRAARGATPKGGSLKVVTSHLRPGYLRKNGVPYSGDAVLTEYWDLVAHPNGEEWITMTSTVRDDKYLREPWVTALNFKKERDGARWAPTPCSAR